MNKNFKRIIAIVFAVGVFSTITPTTNFNFMTTKAYANGTDGVSRLRIKGSNGNSMTIYSDNDYENKVDNDGIEPGAYYAKTGSEGVEVDVDGVDSDCVRAFDGTSSDSNKGVRPGKNISLEDTTTTIVVRIYSKNPGVAKYGDDSYISQYRIKVKYTGSNEDEMKNLYLSTITLSSGTINFSKKTLTYDVTVPEDINKITIGARPNCSSSSYDKYKVRIAGTKVDEDDKYKEEVSLNKGINTVEITVEDDEDNEGTYTLNITRGEATKTNDTNSTDSKNNNASLNNKTTGWVKDGASWYYFGTDGVKKTNWQLINGKWYYLYPQNGAMAYNTTIGMYTLGADGAWIR